MNMKQTLAFVAALLVFVNIDAQVTIGSGKEPVLGALLDLKEFDPNPDNATSRRGLALPRVDLSDLTKLKMGTANELVGADRDTHIGLMVYNTSKIETPNNRVCPGIHVWSGDGWRPIHTYPAIQEEWRVDGVTGGRDFTYLDASSPASEWPEGKTAADYPIGPLGPFTDNRPGEPETYTHARFYTGYKTVKGTFYLYKNYSCDQDPAKFEQAVPVQSEYREYKKFVDGIWMTQNLRATRFPDGTPLTRNGGMSTTVPYYTYPDNQPNEVVEEYGALYNVAATLNTPSGGVVAQRQIGADRDDVMRQGICPDGWRVPADQEWIDLENAFILNPQYFSDEIKANMPATLIKYNNNIGGNEGEKPGYTNSGVGKAMKSKTKINNQNTLGTSKSHTDGGFDILLVGRAKNNSGDFYSTVATFWSSSHGNNTNQALETHKFEQNSKAVFRGFGNAESYLLSVRCIKD